MKLPIAVFLALAVPALTQTKSVAVGAPGQPSRTPQLVGPSFAWSYLNPSNTGVPGDYVHDLYLDGSGDVWIPGYIPFWEQGGLTRWDGSVYETMSNIDWPLIASPRFNEIVGDTQGMLWIATDDGLLRLDPGIGPQSLQRFDSSNTPLLSNDMAAIDVAPDGTLWIALDSIGGGTGGLVRFDPALDQWQQWTTQNGLPWGGEWPGWDDVTSVTVEPQGAGYTVWFGSGPMGLATYSSGSFAWFGLPGSGGPNNPVALKGADPIDSSGNLWLLTNGGLARRAADGTMITVGYPAGLSSEVSEVVALEGGRAALGTFYSDVFTWDGSWTYQGNWGSGSHTYALAEDDQGRLWAAGIGGAARLEGGVWQRYRMTNSGMLGYFMQAVAFAPNGDVYVNGNASPGVGGWSSFDGETWSCANDANAGIGPPWGLPSDEVEALGVLPNGDLLFAPTFNGLWRWDGVAQTQLIPFADVRHIVVDELGRGWAATDNGSLYLIQGDQVTQFTGQNAPLFPGSNVSLVADRKSPGFVWLCSPFGAVQTDGAVWNLFPRELVGLTLNTTSHLLSAAEPDLDGTLWFGTSGSGLFHLDPSDGSFEQFTPANSPLPSDEISLLELGPDGALWIATFDSTWPYPGGLTRFDGGQWRHWSAGSGGPLLHNQMKVLNSRGTAERHELWIGFASEGLAIVTVD